MDCTISEIEAQLVLFFIEEILIQLLPIMMVLKIYRVQNFDNYLSDSLLVLTTSQQESENNNKLKEN
jgi:hypothetical protein